MKKILMSVVALLLVATPVLFLTACGSGGETDSTRHTVNWTNPLPTGITGFTVVANGTNIVRGGSVDTGTEITVSWSVSSGYVATVNRGGLALTSPYTMTVDTNVTFNISATAPTTLATPTGLSIAGTMLSWNLVDNATSYRIYVNNEFRGTSNNDVFNLTSLVLAQNQNAIQVRAVGNGVGFTNSALSTSHIFNIQSSDRLMTPSGVSINFGVNVGTTPRLNWDANPNTNRFNVYMNGQIFAENVERPTSGGFALNINENGDLDADTLLFQVRAIPTTIDDTFNSMLSESATFQIQRHSAPTITNIEGGRFSSGTRFVNVTINWTSPNVQHFSLYLNGESMGHLSFAENNVIRYTISGITASRFLEGASLQIRAIGKYGFSSSALSNAFIITQQVYDDSMRMPD